MRFRTLAATAKDRRTPHHRLKIRPRVRARALKGRRALPGPGGGAGGPAQHGGLDREFGFGIRGAPQAEGNAGVAAGTAGEKCRASHGRKDLRRDELGTEERSGMRRLKDAPLEGPPPRSRGLAAEFVPELTLTCV